MSIDTQALREAVEKATHGEWLLEYGEDGFDGDDALIQCEVQGRIPVARIEGAHPESGFDADFQQEQQANAEFIAAANPTTVLALLDELEAADKYAKERDAENEDLMLTVGRLRVEKEAAEKRIAELTTADGNLIAWESTTPVYIKFITDERYRRLRPGYQKWYKPYRCSNCAAGISVKGE